MVTRVHIKKREQTVSFSFLDGDQRATRRSSQPFRCAEHESSASHGHESHGMSAGCPSSCETIKRLCFLSTVSNG